MTPPECPGCGCTIRTPDDADRDDDARLCPDGRCHGVDPISRVRASRAGGYSTLDLDPRDVDAVLAAHDAQRARADTAERALAEAREELARVRAAVRMSESARERMDAHDRQTLRSLAGTDRAALLEELAAARSERDDWNARATELESDRDYWRTQATMAAPCVDAVRAIQLRLGVGTGCAVDPERAVAAVEGLRAIVEGRETAPTSQEIAVHDGAWIVRYAPARREHYYERVAFCGVGWRQNALDMAAHSETVWWLPLDATGRPCAWPTPVLDAAGEGR